MMLHRISNSLSSIKKKKLTVIINSPFGSIYACTYACMNLEVADSTDFLKESWLKFEKQISS